VTKDTDIYTDRGHDRDTATASGSQFRKWSRPQDTRNSGGTHPSTGGPSGLRIKEVPVVNTEPTSSPLLYGSDPAVRGRDNQHLDTSQ